MRPFWPGRRNVGTPISNHGRVEDLPGYAGRCANPLHQKCGIKSVPVLGNGLASCVLRLTATPGAWKSFSTALETLKTVVFPRRVSQPVFVGRVVHFRLSPAPTRFFLRR